jgi:hypothetical protein
MRLVHLVRIKLVLARGMRLGLMVMLLQMLLKCFLQLGMLEMMSVRLLLPNAGTTEAP